MSVATGEVNAIDIKQFDPNSLLEEGQGLDPLIGGGLKQYFVSIVRSLPGSISTDTATELTEGIASAEAEFPLYSMQPFRYPAVPNLADQKVRRSAESTARSAVSNMYYMLGEFGIENFVADSYLKRNQRLIHWIAPLDDDYQLRARGASGSGTFSLDLGIGVLDRTRQTRTVYKELWRTGIDTVHTEESFGTRFIRTGSGIKPNDIFKSEAFDQFRKRHGIMPQRLLGLVGLYFMREAKPDYAVAITTEGGKRISTLGRSKGNCNYTGIFSDIGFEVSDDTYYLVIPDFDSGFYDALERAGINGSEERTLDTAIDQLNEMTPSRSIGNGQHNQLFRLCSDESPTTIERELALAMSSSHRPS